MHQAEGIRMHRELHALYQEDLTDARTFRGDEAFLASQARRARVAIIIETDGLHTTDDFFHAAFVYSMGSASNTGPRPTS
jgi:hypothetical protein